MAKAKNKVESVKLEFGSVRQKTPGGTYYFRYQINGIRKEIPLHTTSKEDAIRQAKELIPVTKAKSIDMVAAHVKQAKGLEKIERKLPLDEAWHIYSTHPDRATPHTVSEQLAYKTTFEEFLSFISTLPYGIISIHEVDPNTVESFASWMKTKALAVDTHNRKIKRLRKIFDVLKEYYPQSNPFKSKHLLRNIREEQDSVIRRQAFSRQEELQILAELKNPARKLMNKEEIRIVYHIGMFTGQRLKDCVLMQWQNIDMERRRIYVKQFKTGKEVSIPISPELYEALETAKTWQINQYVCPKSAARYNKLNEAGKNVGNNLVNIDVLRVIRWIGLEPSVSVPGRKKKMTQYGFHSLRHSFASFCAEAGVPKAVLLSILGTDSDIADKYYTHVGDAAQEQAIRAISFSGVEKTDNERIAAAIEFLDKEKPTPENWNRLKEILSE